MPSLPIPDEAVGAAKVAYRAEFPYDENEDYIISLVLAAAAPFLMRQAWEEGWNEGWPMEYEPAFKRNPYGSEQ